MQYHILTYFIFEDTEFVSVSELFFKLKILEMKKKSFPKISKYFVSHILSLKLLLLNYRIVNIRHIYNNNNPLACIAHTSSLSKIILML